MPKRRRQQQQQQPDHKQVVKKQRVAPSGLLSLPDDVLHFLFENTLSSPHDLICVMKTCQTFYSLLHQKKFMVHGLMELNSLKARRYPIPWNWRLTRLQLQLTDTPPLKWLERACSELIFLRIVCNRRSPVNWLAKIKTPHLEHLVVSDGFQAVVPFLGDKAALSCLEFGCSKPLDLGHNEHLRVKHAICHVGSELSSLCSLAIDRLEIADSESRLFTHQIAKDVLTDIQGLQEIYISVPHNAVRLLPSSRRISSNIQWLFTSANRWPLEEILTLFPDKEEKIVVNHLQLGWNKEQMQAAARFEPRVLSVDIGGEDEVELDQVESLQDQVLLPSVKEVGYGFWFGRLVACAVLERVCNEMKVICPNLSQKILKTA